MATVGLPEDVARLREVAGVLTARDVEGIDAADAAVAHRDLRATCDQVLAFAARLLARVEESGTWASSGARSFPEWASGQSRSSFGAARREAELGKALGADLPATASAVASGGMTLEQAGILARLGPTSDVRRAALASDLPDRNEAFLIAKARRMGADPFAREVRRWAARVDAGAHEREHRDAALRERLVFVRRDNGVALDGFLTVEHGDALCTALRGIIGVPAADDVRTSEQRSAAALVELSRLALDRGLINGGCQVRPHVNVHVSWETFVAMAAMSDGVDGAVEGPGMPGVLEPAELDDGQPIPQSVLARIACDSSVTRIVFGPAGEPLDVGRAQRTFTGAQRRGVIARDRSCRYPGCNRPPIYCEVHHVRWWVRDDGPTAVWNGILLCWHHHEQVHQQNLSIVRSSEDGWVFRRPDGEVVRRPAWSGDSTTSGRWTTGGSDAPPVPTESPSPGPTESPPPVLSESPPPVLSESPPPGRARVERRPEQEQLPLRV